MEQTGEGIAATILRLRRHRSVGRIDLLVTRLRLCPARLRAYLRREEGGRAVREIETGGLAEDERPLTTSVADGQAVAESHVVVRHQEGDRQPLLLLILQRHCQAVGLIVAVSRLDIANIVVLLYGLRLAVGDGQPFRQVPLTGAQAEGRRRQHLLPVEDDAIGGLAAVIADRYLQFTTWRFHRYFPGLTKRCRSQAQHAQNVSHCLIDHYKNPLRLQSYTKKRE